MGEAVQKTASTRQIEVGSLGARTPGAGDGGQADGSVGGHGDHSRARGAVSGVRAKALLPTADEVALSDSLAAAISGLASQRVVADRIGASRSLVSQWCTASGTGPSWRLMAAMRERCRSVYVDFLRRELAELDDGPRSGMGPERHLCLVSAELGDVSREIAIALADGDLDDEERARIDRELGELERAVVAMRREVRR